MSTVQPGAGHAATPASKSPWSSDLAILTYLATATVIAHVLTGGRYGFHRDELATLEDARHLACGYVAYPPIAPFFGRLSLQLFGTSLRGFRFFAAVAQAVAVIVTGHLGSLYRALRLRVGGIDCSFSYLKATLRVPIAAGKSMRSALACKRLI